MHSEGRVLKVHERPIARRDRKRLIAIPFSTMAETYTLYAEVPVELN